MHCFWQETHFFIKAAEATNSYTEIQLSVSNDERGIKKEKDIDPENTPKTRSVILQPAYAYIYNNVVSIDFSKTYFTAIITITNDATGEVVYSETCSNPINLNIDLGGESSGSYLIEIEAEDTRLEGSFSL